VGSFHGGVQVGGVHGGGVHGGGVGSVVGGSVVTGARVAASPAPAPAAVPDKTAAQAFCTTTVVTWGACGAGGAGRGADAAGGGTDEATVAASTGVVVVSLTKVMPNTAAAMAAATADRPEQHKRAAPRRRLVLPFLVTEVDLGARVDDVVVWQHLLGVVVIVGPGQCRRRIGGCDRRRDGGSSGSGRRQRGGRVDDPAAVCDQRRALGAVSCGCGVVTTGARRCSERRWVISGMRAPPPTVATADTLAAGTP